MNRSAYSVLLLLCFLLPLKAAQDPGAPSVSSNNKKECLNVAVEPPTEEEYLFDFIESKILNAFPAEKEENVFEAFKKSIIEGGFEGAEFIYSEINERNKNGEEDSCILDELFPLEEVDSKEKEKNIERRKQFKEVFNRFEDVYKFFPLKRKLYGAALEYFPLLTDFHDSLNKRLFPTIEERILKKEYTIPSSDHRMKDLAKSPLLGDILNIIPEFQKQMITIFGDSTPLIHEIVSNEDAWSEKKEDKWTKEKIRHLRDRIVELKQHPKYVETFPVPFGLTDDELMAILYYCDPASAINRLGVKEVKNSKHWPCLYQNIRNGVRKLCYYSESGGIKFLYNGNDFSSVEELRDQKIPLKFTPNMPKGSRMILRVSAPEIKLRRGQGADVGWITLDASIPRRDIFIILPASFHNFSLMEDEEHGLAHNPKLYEWNPPIEMSISTVPSDYLLSSRIPMDLGDIRRNLLYIFSKQYGEKFAMQLLEAFDQVLLEEHLEDVEDILDDVEVEDTESSTILQGISKKMQSFLGELKPVPNVMEMMETLRDIIASRPKMSIPKITHFTFTDPKEEKLIVAVAKSLCIAKAVDTKNGYPILMWLLDAFCRDRIKAHKNLYLQWNYDPFDYPFEKDRFVNDLNPIKWWENDDALCQSIQCKNSEMAQVLKTAVQLLSQKALPLIQLNPSLSPCICDSFDDLVTYTLAFWAFAHDLTVLNDNEHQGLPVQLDLLIIPQLVKKRDPKRKPSDPAENELDGGPLLGSVQQPGGDGGKNSDLMSCFEENGYVKNKNFWVEEVEQDHLQGQIRHMWTKATGKGKVHQNRRYVLIIDRRNQKEKGGKDRIYLFAPREEGILKGNQNIPEAFLSYSKDLFLPNRSRNGAAGMLNGLSGGYRFGLSFHLHKRDARKCYWYFNGGGTKFELEDMGWLWPRYFQKINGTSQRMSNQNMAMMRSYAVEKPLSDIDFEMFYHQV